METDARLTEPLPPRYRFDEGADISFFRPEPTMESVTSGILETASMRRSTPLSSVRRATQPRWRPTQVSGFGFWVLGFSRSIPFGIAIVFCGLHPRSIKSFRLNSETPIVVTRALISRSFFNHGFFVSHGPMRSCSIQSADAARDCGGRQEDFFTETQHANSVETGKLRK